MTGKLFQDCPAEIWHGSDPRESQDLAGMGTGTLGSQSGCWEKISW